MLRRLLVVVVLSGLLGSGSLVVPPVQAGSPGLALVDGTSDVDETPSEPLPHLALPVDPADAISGLPFELDTIPGDASGTAAVDGDWSQVPGLPVEVQVDSVADADPGTVAADPTEGPSPTESPSASPSDSLSESTSPSPSESVTPDPIASDGVEPALGDEVVVSVDQPDDLSQGVLLVSVDVAEPTAADNSTASPDASPGPSASSEPTPTSDPSASAAPDAGAGLSSGVPAEGVDVRVSYGAFDQAFGGGWADRLVVMAYPACYAETPELPECGVGVPVSAVNDPVTNTLTFTTLPTDQIGDPDATPVDPSTVTEQPTTDPSASLSESPSASPTAVESPTDELVGSPATYRVSGMSVSSAVQVARGTVSTVPVARTAGLAMLAGTSSGGAVYSVVAGGGNYAATPFSSASQWQVGTGTGEFSYSYPFQLPEALGGRTPDLGLQYSSGSVDAMSLLENGQASQAGIGWDLSVGSISRSFAACSDDGHPAKGDLCWKTADGAVVNRYDLTLNGRSSLLVPIAGTTSYRLQDDPGWRVERIMDATPEATDPDNSGYNNEAFKVTTPDGTEYWFGWGHGTNSTFTVPVYGNDTGERCNKPVLEDSWCQQTWQWNLDRVVDGSGNIVRYSYAKETNYYARWANTTTANRTVYDRAGILAKVEYGYRDGGTPHQLVELTTLDRCNPQLTDPTANCTGANNAQSSPGKWPDTPSDLLCSQTGSCTVGSPTFFSTLRLYQVTTKTIQTTGVPSPVTRKVDTWTFAHTMPPPTAAADTPDLWLNRITRTGFGDSSAEITVPPVMFDAIEKQNRVVVPAGQRPLKKNRIAEVRNETGGRIQVTYGHADNRACDSTYVNGLNRWASERECFAQMYDDPSTTAGAHWEWFHKYVVTRLALADDTLGYRLGGPANSTILGQLRVFDYEYNGTPAWRFADSPFLPTNEESWTDWRGYEQTVVHTRKTSNGQLQSGDEAQQRVVRYRGMDGTKENPYDNVNERSLQFVATPGVGTVRDQRGLAGRTAETAVLRSNGDLISRSYTGYESLLTVSGQEPYNAWLAYTNTQITTTAVTNADGTAGADRVHRVDYTINDGGTDHRGILAGAVTQVEDRGDLATSSDNTCTTATYRTNSTAWVRVPELTGLYDSRCEDKSADTLVSSSKNFYDNQEDDPNASLSRGLVTQTATFAGGGDPKSKFTYDVYGRLLSSETGTSDVTTIEYNPGGSASDLLTDIKTSSPWITGIHGLSGHKLVNTATFDVRRGNTLSVTDENTRVTRLGYDALGRLSTVSLPGNTGSGGTEPYSMEFTYTLSAGQPSRIKTQVQRAGSTVDSSYAFADGWGRTIETHTPRPFNPGDTVTNPDARIVSVAGYDDQGQVGIAIPALANPNDPFNAADKWKLVVNPDPANVDRYTTTDYDAAGRPVQLQEMSRGLVRATGATMSTSYRGDHTIVDQPGAGKTDTTLDWWGRAAQVDVLDAGSVEDTASYTYTAAGQLATITKDLNGAQAGDSVWRYFYDGAGRQTFSLDPDTGATQSVYDANSNPTTAITGTGLDSTIAPTAINGVQSRLATAYDSLNRPTDRTDTTVAGSPVGLSWWTYDDPSVTNGQGRLTAAGQPVTSIKGPGDITGTYTARVGGYDTRGNVTVASQSYPSYLTGETGTNGSVTKQWSYGYNDAGLLTQTVYPAAGNLGARAVNTVYTTGGRLDTMTSPITGGTVTVADASYDNLGQTIGLDSSGDGKGPLERSYGWDPTTARLASLTGNANQDIDTTLDFDYAYDLLGNPTRAKATLTQPNATATGQTTTVATWCYGYDGLNRLATATTGLASGGTDCTLPSAAQTAGVQEVTGAPAYDLAYTYDIDRLDKVTNNALGAAGAHPTASYGYPTSGAPHPASKIDRDATGTLDPALPPAITAMTYDPVGRITKLKPAVGGETTYGYDNTGALISSTGGGHDLSYSYTDSGLRLARREQLSAGQTDTTVFLGDTELSKDTAAATLSAVRHYTTPDGVSVASETGAGWTFTLTDAQGTPRLTRGPDGKVNRYNNYPYGDPTPTVGGSPTPGNRRYLNKTLDPGGDLRLDHRNFSAGLNIFTTPDPLINSTDPGSLNPYAYAANNPIALSDPSGLVWKEDRVDSAEPDGPVAPGYTPEPDPIDVLLGQSNGYSGCPTENVPVVPYTGPGDPSDLDYFMHDFTENFRSRSPVWSYIPVTGQALAAVDMFTYAYEGDAEGVVNSSFGLLPAKGGLRPRSTPVNGGGFYRKVSNTGAFAGLPERMSLRNVRDVAREAGIGLDGVRVKIVRDPNLIGTKFAGHTPNAKTIELYPDAFTSRTALRQTLGHERTHIYQWRMFGKPTDATELAKFEDVAYALDYQW